ncbi:peptide chain release factor N(5)-glutamine methyltransferase [Xanthobacter sp. TB0139]|uniref:peptide chain release factor N(5)-glutamine methyltransferase n=1 Tax=Xanthobacter sp. TB0139 TaxID=3459178 RepID=UPI0040397431
MSGSIFDMRDVANLRALRRQMTAELVVSGVSAPDLEARLLLSSALNCTPSELIQHDDEMVTPDVAQRAMALMMRRITGEPVARILGHREFWSLDFQLSPDTLVPRPDTETVIEVALDAFPERDAALRILDLGTGSGAILAALLVERPQALGVGVDRAEGAARTALDNFDHVGVGERAFAVVGDWGAGLVGGFDLVVSNPPYITSHAMLILPREVRSHDPALALDGGVDGLDAYRAIIADAPRLLCSGGLVVLELGVGQEEDVSGLLKAAGLVVCGPAKPDLAGIPRAISARKP